MPATVQHILSATTPDDPTYEIRLKQREANRRSYYKHHEERKAKCRENSEKRRIANPNGIKEYTKNWNETNKERNSELRAIRRPKYKEKELAYSKEYRAKHPEKYQAYYKANREKWRAQYQDWSKRNPQKEAARAAKRRAAKIQATPKWADLKKIEVFYVMAYAISQETGISHDVDHIVPLRGKNVCGLHCEFNLQVLESRKNESKGNKWA